MKTILILILIVLTIGILIGGFYVWNNYQEKERQYQSCLKYCKSISFGQEFYDLCETQCNTEYGK